MTGTDHDDHDDHDEHAGDPGDAGTAHWGEAVAPTPSAPARPGDIVVGGGVVRLPEPMVGGGTSTPLAHHGADGTIPPCPLWAMTEHRHTQWHLLPAHDRHDQLSDHLGSGDAEVYVIDDGRHHVMVGRRVGARGEECEYCLVGRVPRQRYEDLRDQVVAVADAFDGATGITLCGVVTVESVLASNVFDVERYGDAGEVPAEYLPGAPFIAFAEDLEITAD